MKRLFVIYLEKRMLKTGDLEVEKRLKNDSYTNHGWGSNESFPGAKVQSEPQ